MASDPAKDPPTAEEVAKGLSDPAPAIRLKAALALAEMGRAAVAAIPELEEALADKNEDVRAAVRDALTRFPEGRLVLVVRELETSSEALHNIHDALQAAIEESKKNERPLEKKKT